MAILRWGGGGNEEGKSQKSVMEEVSFEINLEGEEDDYFLAGQGDIISEAVGAPGVPLLAAYRRGSENEAKEGRQNVAEKED